MKICHFENNENNEKWNNTCGNALKSIKCYLYLRGNNVGISVGPSGGGVTSSLAGFPNLGTTEH